MSEDGIPYPRGQAADAQGRAAGVEARHRIVGEWGAERRIGRERRAVAQGTLRASCGSRACGPRRSRPVICSHRVATWEDGLTAFVRLRPGSPRGPSRPPAPVIGSAVDADRDRWPRRKRRQPGYPPGYPRSGARVRAVVDKPRASGRAAGAVHAGGRAPRVRLRPRHRLSPCRRLLHGSGEDHGPAGGRAARPAPPGPPLRAPRRPRSPMRSSRASRRGRPEGRRRTTSRCRAPRPARCRRPSRGQGRD